MATNHTAERKHSIAINAAETISMQIVDDTKIRDYKYDETHGNCLPSRIVKRLKILRKFDPKIYT